MRLAWFSPVPPVRTGIAGKSAELIAALRARGVSIDPYSDRASTSDVITAESAHDFVWRHAQRPYDLTVFQFGNSSHHDYIWPYALRYPGLVVLHDARLHHARAALLLRERRADDYRREFAWNHPGANPDLAELAVAGLDSPLYYQWPMARTLLASARLVAVHGEGTRQALIDELHHQGIALSEMEDRIVAIRLGEGQTLGDEEARTARARVRAAHRLPADAIVFGVFGGLTPEKRIPQVLEAFAALRPHAPGATLMLVGAPAAHYDVRADIAAHDLADRVIVTGYLASEAELIAHIAACDVSLNLRWPTARETSGPWLRALAAGLPTVVTDLVHQTGFASLDPRTWTVAPAARQPPAANRQPTTDDRQLTTDNRQPPTDDRQPTADNRQPICVTIDILDEQHSLRLAMRRLAVDVDFRDRLGRAGRAWWAREYSFEGMVDDYEDAIGEAMRRPAPSANLPAHADDVGDRLLRALVAPFGVAPALSRDRLLR